MEIKELIEHAKKEQWDLVDKQVPKIASDYRYIDWAKTLGINNEDPNVRDLALSILEMAQLDDKEKKEIEIGVYAKMQSDSVSAVKYRAAFVLASHDFQKNREEIKSILQEASKNPDFKDRAKSYLETFNE